MFIKNIVRKYERNHDDLEQLIKNSSLIFGRIADPFFIVDKDFVVQYMNPSALKASRYKSDEVIGKMTCDQITKTPLCHTSRCTLKNCFLSKSEVIDKTKATAKDGSSFNMRVSSNAILNENKEVIGGLVQLEDITKQTNIGNNLVTLAKQVSLSSDKLSSSFEEVNAAIDEIGSTIQKISEDANNTSEQTRIVLDQSKNAGDAAKRGKDAADQVNTKMQEIQRTTEVGVEGISSLGEKSKEIGNIVDTINQISEQTNLLALNAAIEAARAGEAGRGFAVVADEVRKLAEESSQATKQISKLILGIQNEIESSVASMNESAKQVEAGSEGVTEAMKSFDELPPIIETVNDAALKVSTVIQGNAAGSQQASAAMQEISSSVQEVTGNSQDLSEIAERLVQISRELTE